MPFDILSATTEGLIYRSTVHNCIEHNLLVQLLLFDSTLLVVPATLESRVLEEGTLSHLKSFLESAVPPIRLFLLIIIMPLKRWVAEENYFTALLRNEARNELLMSGP